MKLDRKVQYAINIAITICVYTLLFGLCLLDVKDYIVQPDDQEELLCMITGFPLTEQPLDGRQAMIKWMLGFSVLFILVGREIYDQQDKLKYIAMIRYSSYRRFYRNLINRTVFSALLYGSTGALNTYVLYICAGNGQVSSMKFLEISVMWLSQLLLLCLLQTLCMILVEGFTVSVILLVLWFGMAICAHLAMRSGWIWLPMNWGMYIRSAGVIPGGVPDKAYYIQVGMCFLLWAGVPLVIKGNRTVFNVCYTRKER